MTKADIILTNLIEDVGIVAAKLLANFIDQYPHRSYYQFWFIPRSKEIMKRLGIGRGAYYQILDELCFRKLISKQYDRKIKQMLYSINFELLDAYDPNVQLPGSEVILPPRESD
jgi:hypothetical protein